MVELPVATAAPPTPGSGPAEWSQVELDRRPHEIATVYLDLVLGRKVTRDLDAHRAVWATAHRVEGTGSEATPDPGGSPEERR